MYDEWKAKWVAALRSGEYKQISGQLRNAAGHCCLGVLCDISGAGGWSDNNYIAADDERSGSLPFGVLDLTDISFADERRLADMNDSGATFAEIADYIEKSL